MPDSIKSKSVDIEWKEIAGMRDRLIHNYFAIDFEIVWDVVQNEIPTLKEKIEKIINYTKEWAFYLEDPGYGSITHFFNFL